MSQGTIPVVKYIFSRFLVFVVVVLVSACAADEQEHVKLPAEQPVQREEVQVREWYPTPKLQQSPYYVFTPGAGQYPQRQQPAAASSFAPGGAGAGQAWQGAPYPPQQDYAQYPESGNRGVYGQFPAQQQPAFQPAAPVYPYAAAPAQQQSGQPQAPVLQYQPYQSQPQYQPAQRPWGVPGYNQGGSASRQGSDTWQVPGYAPGGGPPAYNDNSGRKTVYPGMVVPGYQW